MTRCGGSHQCRDAGPEEGLDRTSAGWRDESPSRLPARRNQRNGTGGKTILTEDGEILIEEPRDHDVSFAPLLIPKRVRRFSGFDDKIVAKYAGGDRARDSGLPAGAIRDRSLAGVHQFGHRQGDGRSAAHC